MNTGQRLDILNDKLFNYSQEYFRTLITRFTLPFYLRIYAIHGHVLHNFNYMYCKIEKLTIDGRIEIQLQEYNHSKRTFYDDGTGVFNYSQLHINTQIALITYLENILDENI